ncbi:SH3 domain-containing protein, partial [Candidatus Curtissbacteria bacterium]|nr:SH3 domain-containing protein [Candidatus Curtissbacteria bacterium]
RDASLNSPEIGRVKPTEQYELIQESNGWVKISFDGKQGWISNQYTKKL